MIPLRFVLTLLMTCGVGVLISGCETRGVRLSEKQKGDSKIHDPKSEVASVYTLAAAKKRLMDEQVKAGNAATNTVFSPYDSKVIHAIQQHWYELLGDTPVDKPGMVVIDFRLHADGHVSDVRIAHTTADEKTALICQKAVLESAPFASWSQEMRKATASEYRDVRFTFYYN